MCACTTQTSTLALSRRPMTTMHPKTGDAYTLPDINLKPKAKRQKTIGGHGAHLELRKAVELSG